MFNYLRTGFSNIFVQFVQNVHRTVRRNLIKRFVIISKRSYVQYAKVANHTISSQTARGDVSTIRYPQDGAVITEMKEDVKHVKMLFTMMKSGLAKHVTRSDKNIKDLLSSQGRIRDPRNGPWILGQD